MLKGGYNFHHHLHHLQRVSQPFWLSVKWQHLVHGWCCCISSGLNWPDLQWQQIGLVNYAVAGWLAGWIPTWLVSAYWLQCGLGPHIPWPSCCVLCWRSLCCSASECYSCMQFATKKDDFKQFVASCSMALGLGHLGEGCFWGYGWLNLWLWVFINLFWYPETCVRGNFLVVASCCFLCVGISRLLYICCAGFLFI